MSAKERKLSRRLEREMKKSPRHNLKALLATSRLIRVSNNSSGLPPFSSFDVLDCRGSSSLKSRPD